MAYTMPPLYCGECEKNHDLLRCNQPAWRVFLACLRQTNLSPNGDLLGLRLEAVYSAIDRLAPGADFEATYAKVAIGEQAMLEWAKEQAEKRERARKVK